MSAPQFRGKYGTEGSHSFRGSRIKNEEGLREIIGPIQRAFLMAGVGAVRSGRFREGVYYLGAELGRWVVAYKWCCESEKMLMNILEELKTNYDGAKTLWADYEKKLDAFRSAIKNDVSSLEASARKTTEAVNRMNSAYGTVIAQMNSHEMAQAIANAERLASAMAALAGLQSHKLVFAVTDESEATRS